MIKSNYLSLIFLTFAFVLLSSLASLGQSNPMFGSSDSDETDSIQYEDVNLVEEQNSEILKTEESPSNSFTSSFNKLMRKNNLWQMKLRGKIVKYAKNTEEQGAGKTYLWILLISFLYGIAHSLGPGHNKILVFTYFLGEKAKIKEGLILGNITAFIHALSGLIVSLIILYVIKETTTFQFDQSDASVYIKRISFGLISLIGILLLVGHIRNFRKKNKAEAPQTSMRKILPMALGLGLIPCPGTMILVSFLSIAGLQSFAPWAALAMGAGMAFTISLIGIITIISKDSIFKIFENNHPLLQKLQFSLAVFGSLMIIVIGLVFMV